MERAFSSINRSVYLEEMTEKALDLLIIGGGVTGAGILLDAQSRGIKTGLIEMQDFGAGTSSRSTKLVHGGLRYLKQFELKLVSEVGKERAIVYENAPHVTTPEWMLLPIIEGGTFGKWSTSLGLKLYDYLAGVKNSERRYMLNKEKTLEKEPLLQSEKLKGSGVYVEYKTDDARLTIEIIKEAFSRGALAVNYMKVERLIYKNTRLIGVKVVDQLNGVANSIYAKKIVNATGPWVDTIREKDHSKDRKTLFLTKGVHIVLDQRRFPLKQAVYFDTEKDGRMCFAIPRDGKIYIGTTDTSYKGNIDEPRMAVADRDYLLNAIKWIFPTVLLTADDVEASWSGLRPLIYEKGKEASEISRKDEVFVSNSGLISIAGGKLTGYRKMAQRIVDIVCKDLKCKRPCSTDQIILSGGEIGGSSNLSNFLSEKSKEGMEIGLTLEEAYSLARRYGSNIEQIYAIIRTRSNDARSFGLPIDLFAAVVYGIEREMVTTPVDFFNRRTSALFFQIDWVKQWKKPVVEYMKYRFRWSSKEANEHIKKLDREIEFATVALEKE